MKDIEQIKPYVFSRLYSSIFIRDSVKPKALKLQHYYRKPYLDDYYRKFYLEDISEGDYVAEFETIESFVQVVDENEFIRPKKNLSWKYQYPN